MEENNFSKSFFVKCILLTVIVTALITSMITIIISNNTGNKDLIEKIETKLGIVQANIDADYLGEIDENKILESTVKGYVAGLEDEYSEYFTKEELEEYKSNNIEGAYVGIGVYIIQDVENNAIRVIAPISESPAEEAGIRPGDYIVKIDGEEVTGEDIEEASNKMKGEEGSKVKLQILRGEETIDLEVERKNVKVNHVESEIYEDKIGYLKIASFDENCSVEFEEKLEELQSKNIESLIIDLRNNGGGIVDEALAIADLFTDKDATLLITKDKEENEEVRKSKTDEKVDLPVIVLTNENTASASELLVGVLKDYNIATSVGTVTFGKGVIQELLTLPDESGLKITTNEYYTPNGNKINKIGIEPDEKVELPDEYKNVLNVPKDKDTQLNKAIELLK